jgi:hypothetical protein
MYVFMCARVFARCSLQRLLEARLRVVFCRARLQHLEMGAGKWRALVRRFTARRYSAIAGDALTAAVGIPACHSRSEHHPKQ